jgi:hypothetical protein
MPVQQTLENRADMAIPESQLDTWSHQGSVQQSSDTFVMKASALLRPGADFQQLVRGFLDAPPTLRGHDAPKCDVLYVLQVFWQPPRSCMLL